MNCKKTRLVLHDYETVEQIWVDPDSIALVQRLPATDNLPARTKVATKGEYGVTVLVSELPDHIATSSRWRLAMPCPMTEAEYAQKTAQIKKEKDEERNTKKE